ncbi:MAG: response regulator [Anaerolineales bacterium]|nr:response regulator [Anaerolineales bacterium]
MAEERRVLIVDDDVDFADSLNDMLAAEEYTVAVAHAADEALAAVETFDPQVALLDLRLPAGEGDGLDLLAALKQKKPGLLGIVVTAYADTDTVIKALHGDAYDYLRKPLYFQELATTLRRCYERLELEVKNRRMLSALRASEERYRSIFENALEGIFRITPSAGFVDVNPALVQMLGYSSPEEVLALDLRQDLYQDPQELRFLIDQHRARKAVRNLEAVWKKKNGDPITVSISSRIIFDDQDRALYYEGLVQDVTERKRAEEKLQHQFQRLAALRAIDLAITTNFDLRLIFNLLLDQGLPQLRVDAAAVLLFNPHLQILEYAAGRGFWGEAVARSRVPLGEGPAGRAALERRSIHIADLANLGPGGAGPGLEGEGFVSAYVIPLVVKGGVKGVLELFHRSPLAVKPDWKDFAEMLAEQAAIAIDNTALFEDLQRSNTNLAMAYDTTLEGWSRALDLRDRETEGHTKRVTELTLRLCRVMGMGESELAHVRRGAILHDIGKMAIPDSILLKPAPLTEEEWEIMRRHPVYAYEMLSPIDYLRPALDIPYCHHEKWDGTGYPRQLRGEQIPPAARIFAVVDVWDALRSGRPYRAAWSQEKVLEHIRSLSGSYFDSRVVEQFLKMEL